MYAEVYAEEGEMAVPVLSIKQVRLQPRGGSNKSQVCQDTCIGMERSVESHAERVNSKRNTHEVATVVPCS